MELLRAGPALEEKLAAFRSEVDDVLVLLMERRLETARRVGEVGGEGALGARERPRHAWGGRACGAGGSVLPPSCIRESYI